MLEWLEIDSCRDCIHVSYLIGKDQFWCSRKEDYVDPDHISCSEFEPKTEGPLVKFLNQKDD